MPVEQWNVVLGKEPPTGRRAAKAEPGRPGSAPANTPEIAVPFIVQSNGLPLQITLHLPQAHPALDEVLAAEMEDLYVLFGSGALEALRAGMERMADVGSTGAWMAEAKSIYRRCWGSIQERADQTRKQVEGAAAKIALARLSASREEILSEAVRYLAGVRTARDAERLFHTRPPSGLKIVAEGGETEGLILALLKVRGLRHELARALGQYQTRLDSMEGEPHPYPLAHLRAMSSAVQKPPQQDEEVPRARQAVAEAHERVLVETARFCTRYPIIHRLHATATLPDNASATTCRLRKEEAAFGQGVTLLSVPGGEIRLIDFAREVYLALKDSFDAAEGIKQAIEQDPAEVWDYPVLIEAALDALDYDWDSFECRAAAERLPENAPDDWINEAAALAGAGMVVFEPAPPVAAVFGVVALILTTASLGVQAWQNYRNGRAARAALDPAKCLAGEPTWGFFLLNIAMMVVVSRVLPKRLLDTLMLVQGAEAASGMLSPGVR